MDVLLEKLKCLLDVTLFSIVFQTTKVINMLNSCFDFMQEPILSSKISCVSTLCGPHTYIVHQKFQCSLSFHAYSYTATAKHLLS